MLGVGTQTDPYIIQTEDDLNLINSTSLSAYYELGNNITMQNPFTPIKTFSGTIDGKGYKIFNLVIDQAKQDVGFVSYLNGGTIKNLGLENVSIQNNGKYTGALCGETYNGLIENCYATGTVQAKTLSSSTNTFYGGLVGQINGTNFRLKNSYSKCTVRAYNYVGGLVGYFYGGYVEKCYATGNVSTYVGGSSRKISGLINNGISTYVTNSYFDSQTTGVSDTSNAGIPKTTAEMKTQSTYTNWDFTNVWGIDNDYPFLRVFGIPVVAKKQTIDIKSYVNAFYSKVSKTNKAIKQTQSFSNAIQTFSERHTATKRISTTFTLPIKTSVQKSNRTVRRSIANVNTYINPVASIVERKTKTMKQLLSYVDHIKTNVNVIAPVKNKVVNAYVSIVENPSSVQIEENLSSTYLIENPSDDVNYFV
ncbi:GLUG motif-containing protein [Bacillus smithii]|uniref:GLUG domain-containing protein n=1 Tax=Bacillus smithii 7_3_47FAA TaxID=665952 RepID=G9QIR0_9BACI|nr:GLUG motif-containing protein [Bacillus smithii]EHL78959.1 hypothetical protein HMPREF1015_02987 [Bacillus smithii 7_3_47FAA]